MIAQAYISQARVLIASHTLQLPNHVLQSERLPGRLCRARLQLDMHNMNMEMIIRRLIVDVEFELVPLKLWVQLDRRIEHFLSHMLQPLHLAFLQIAHAPDIPALDDAEKMQR